VTLRKKDWCEVVSNAFEEDRHPAMAVEIAGVNLYVIDAELFELLQHVVQEVEDGTRKITAAV
jgi:hypothetical protein